MKKFDFSGYATKNDLLCSDGRTILKDAFKHQDGKTVPLVWQHMHNDPENVLGHAVLENRLDGVYCHGSFNDTEAGKRAKELVEHGDISSLSIYANQLKEKSKMVIHGSIREVSLVLSGANPGAIIDNISFAHSDGSLVEDETEAIIYTGLSLTHDDEEDKTHEVTEVEHSEKTVGDVFNTFTDEQKLLVHAMIAKAVDGETVEHSDEENAPTETHETTEDDQLQHAADTTIKDVFDTFTEDQKNVVYYLIQSALDNTMMDGTVQQSDLEGENDMKSNVFDNTTETKANVLTHDQLNTIVTDAKRHGSLKESFLAHAVDYGFNPVDVLFPDAKDVNAGGPTTIQRDTTWVDVVLGAVNKTPFARIRTRFADITADAARAKGYVTGNLKTEEVITLTKRITTPTTIYKKQKLDRDDMVDITDFDVVSWLKGEMRGMLNEELARAILIGDGRSVADEDKVNELNIRPISLDDGNVFVHRKQVAFAETTDNIIDEFIRLRKNYKGSGVPSLFIGTDLLTEMMLLKDQFGHRLYKTVQELASVLRVSQIVEVEPMNTAIRTVGANDYTILGIIVNLKDYTVGADKGGQVGMFDDFDIDYNQYKYLIETRASGALTMPKSALIVERSPEVVV